MQNKHFFHNYATKASKMQRIKRNLEQNENKNRQMSGGHYSVDSCKHRLAKCIFTV
jgi:hypothetical protein